MDERVTVSGEIIVLNDQGGGVMSVSDKPSTLTDEAVCYPVIRPEIVMASTAEHAEMTDGRIAPCLMARAGTGGNQLPIICGRIKGMTDGDLRDRESPAGFEGQDL